MRGFSKTEVAGFFLTGAAIGAVAGLMLAPKTGAQTRRDLRRFSKKTMDQLDDLQSDVREQITDRYEQVLDVVDNVKEFVGDGKTRLQRMIKTS
jgi:gas vesicle protein